MQFRQVAEKPDIQTSLSYSRKPTHRHKAWTLETPSMNDVKHPRKCCHINDYTVTTRLPYVI